ncbi:NAD(P)-dependent oxidoreductase [Mycobacterium sp. RTGN5]|uniref:NAD-dependent epimerase/dehydratase family protein n=1 Tax=Mycobacterium sp. RTGN5 TaxID=3016522 RepID=UPI0029C664F4|nr:NAD(P)-dependent oxidoreductase [Mycobacterium sp. RTGN5]
MSCTVVVTGAAGNLGRRLVPHLEARGHRVRPVDRVASDDPGAIVAELSVPGAWRDVFAGARTLVHLAGNGMSSASWTDLVADNVDTLLLVLDAAAAHGVRRVVFASSVWANRGRWPSPGPIAAGAADPGDNAYGMTKALGERAVAAFVATTGGVGIAVRIGGRPPGDQRPIRLDDWEDACWLGPTDFVNGITRAVEGEVDGFRVVNLVSDNPSRRWSLDEAREILGYVPEQHYDPRPRPPSPSKLRLFARRFAKHL